MCLQRRCAVSIGAKLSIRHIFPGEQPNHHLDTYVPSSGARAVATYISPRSAPYNNFNFNLKLGVVPGWLGALGAAARTWSRRLPRSRRAVFALASLLRSLSRSHHNLHHSLHVCRRIAIFLLPHDESCLKDPDIPHSTEGAKLSPALPSLSAVR